MKIRVYYEDVDVGGVVYHSKYLNFCERARSELFFEKGLSPIEGEYHFVVRHINADFLSPAKFGDIITIRSSLIELKGASLRMLQEISNQNSMKIFSMQVTLVCLKGDKVSKIPEYFKAILHTNS